MLAPVTAMVGWLGCSSKRVDRFELVEREHAIHLFDERNKPLHVRRRQPADVCEPLRQHHRIIHPLH